MIKFSGSLVALITPMKKSGAVDFEALSRLIDWHLNAGTQGLVVLGTTGESATLNAKEQEAIVRHSVKEVAGRIPVIAGTGSNCTQTTIDKTRHANEWGVDACLVVTPYYNRPTQEGLLLHYQSVAEASEKPIILYNVPSRTGCDLLPETVAHLAVLKGIIGIKDASPHLNRIQQLKSVVPANFLLLSGEDGTALHFLQSGGQGIISVTANVVPEQLRAFCDACSEKDFTLAKTIDTHLQALHQVLFLESNPIPTKWLLSQVKAMPSGIRLPLTPLTAQHHDTVLAAFDAVQTVKQSWH